LNDVLIFLSFKAARAVNENSSRLQQRDYSMRNLNLPRVHPIKVRRFQTPSDIDPASHHASIGAGSINQNSIEWRCRRNLRWNGRFHPIMANDFGNSNTKPREIFVE